MRKSDDYTFQYPEGHSSGFHKNEPVNFMVIKRQAFQYPEGHSSGFHSKSSLAAS